MRDEAKSAKNKRNERRSMYNALQKNRKNCKNKIIHFISSDFDESIKKANKNRVLF